MALVFYTNPEAPVRCAMELSRALKGHSRLQLRMGIHSGPVSGVVDVTGRTNLAGAGLNLAQRVMKCGDAGHILLSKHVAEDLEDRSKSVENTFRILPNMASKIWMKARHLRPFGLTR